MWQRTSANRPLVLFSPTGNKAQFTDAAGLPFWFNGQDELGFTKGLLPPKFGRTVNKGGSGGDRG